MNGLQIMLDTIIVNYKALEASSEPNSTHDMFLLMKLLTKTYETLKDKRMKKEAQMVAKALTSCNHAFATGYFKPYTKSKLT